MWSAKFVVVAISAILTTAGSVLWTRYKLPYSWMYTSACILLMIGIAYWIKPFGKR